MRGTCTKTFPWFPTLVTETQEWLEESESEDDGEEEEGIADEDEEEESSEEEEEHDDKGGVRVENGKMSSCELISDLREKKKQV